MPRLTCLAPALLTSLALVGAPSAAAAPDISRAAAAADADFETLDARLAVATAQLAELIDRANAEGLSTDYARVSLHTIAIFRRGARSDHENPELIRKIFSGYRFYKESPPELTENIAVEQLADCLDVAAHATDELTRQLAGELTLAAPPDMRSPLRLDPGTPYYRIGDRVVFPSSLVWLAGGPELREAFGRIEGIYFQLRDLRPDGTVRPPSLKKMTRGLTERREQKLSPLVSFIGHAAADWMVEKHPEVLKGGRNFVRYDIDSPLIRGWLDDLYAGLYPAFSTAAGDTVQMHLLANEPHFATKKRGWKVKEGGFSEFTRAKYRVWLEAKYGTIAALNKAQAASFKSFEDVEIELPIDPALRGGPLWYDWCRFNMDRVNDWFAYQKEVAHKYDPNKSPVSIKLLGHTLGDSSRDQGMDLEFLIGLQDISGADLRAAPRTASFHGKAEGGLTPATDWRTHFAYDWSDQTAFLDFSKSLAPDKPFYDSEWHGLGAVAWRDFNLDRAYVRSAVWGAFTHGMGLIKPWVWGRNADGSLTTKTNNFGELSTQPVAADAFGRVMKELNAHAPAVAAVVPRERNFLIYYCEEAAIQDGEYPAGFAPVYEALKLLNVSVGFATPTSLAGLDPQRQVVVLPPTPHVADASRDALNAFRKAGGRVVAIDAKASFRKTEMGADRPKRDGVQADAEVAALPALELADALAPALSPLTWPSPVDVTVSDAEGQPAYGVLVQHAIQAETGRVVVVLNNVSRDARTVVLSPGTGWTDLLTGQPHKGPVELESCGVRLLEAAAR